jgi:hypothetical protein
MAQSPKAPTYDPRLSVHTIVREDVFAGFMTGDLERMARGEKAVDLLLTERPADKAPLLAWKGSIAMNRAVLANAAKRPAEFDREYKKAQAFYAEAMQVGPDDGGVQAIVAASQGMFADGLPEPQRRAAWDASYAAFRVMWKLQEAGVDRMPLHIKGELLGGMAQTAQRTGRAEEASQFVERILTSMPGTAYAAVAQKWKDSPEMAAKTTLLCHSCHEPGRLEARKATLAAAK